MFYWDSCISANGCAWYPRAAESAQLRGSCICAVISPSSRECSTDGFLYLCSDFPEQQRVLNWGVLVSVQWFPWAAECSTEGFLYLCSDIPEQQSAQWKGSCTYAVISLSSRVLNWGFLVSVQWYAQATACSTEGFLYLCSDIPKQQSAQLRDFCICAVISPSSRVLNWGVLVSVQWYPWAAECSTEGFLYLCSDIPEQQRVLNWGVLVFVQWYPWAAECSTEGFLHLCSDIPMQQRVLNWGVLVSVQWYPRAAECSTEGFLYLCSDMPKQQSAQLRGSCICAVISPSSRVLNWGVLVSVQWYPRAAECSTEGFLYLCSDIPEQQSAQLRGSCTCAVISLSSRVLNGRVLVSVQWYPRAAECSTEGFLYLCSDIPEQQSAQLRGSCFCAVSNINTNFNNTSRSKISLYLTAASFWHCISWSDVWL